MFGIKYTFNYFNVVKLADINGRHKFIFVYIGKMFILVYIWITVQYVKEAESEAERMITAGTAPEGVTSQGLKDALEY